MEKKKVLFTLFCVLESGAMGFFSNHLTKWCGSVFICLGAALMVIIYFLIDKIIKE